MKAAVIYQSTYGHTEQYAKWIAEALGADLISGKKATVSDLMPYDTLIFGGPVYIGSIKGGKLLRDNFAQLAGKRIALFTVALTPVDNAEGYVQPLSTAMPENAGDAVRVFHFPGGVETERLSLPHRMMMSMVRKMQASGKPDAPGGGMPPMDKEGINLVSQKAIEPLLAYVRS